MKGRLLRPCLGMEGEGRPKAGTDGAAAAEESEGRPTSAEATATAGEDGGLLMACWLAAAAAVSFAHND